MQGLFKCKALGKTPEKSKSGKYHYLFVNGNQDKSGLFTSFSVIDCWLDVDVPVVFGKEYNLVLDVNGDYIKVVSIQS